MSCSFFLLYTLFFVMTSFACLTWHLKVREALHNIICNTYNDTFSPLFVNSYCALAILYRPNTLLLLFGFWSVPWIYNELFGQIMVQLLIYNATW